MTVDTKALCAAALADQKRDNTILLRPSLVIEICDLIEQLQREMKKARKAEQTARQKGDEK